MCQRKKALRSDANCCIHVLLCIVAQRELLISVECIPKRGATSADVNIYLLQYKYILTSALVAPLFILLSCTQVHDNKQINISVSC